MFLQAKLSLSLILSAVFKGTVGGSPPGKKKKQTKKTPLEVPPLPYKYIGATTKVLLELQNFEKTHLSLLKEK